MHTSRHSRDGTRSIVRPPPLDLSRHALFLDVDGTLVGIQERPELVLPEPALTTLLTELCARMQGAVAILTGRTIVDADRILERVVPFVAGVHGQQRRHGAEVISEVFMR